MKKKLGYLLSSFALSLSLVATGCGNSAAPTEGEKQEGNGAVTYEFKLTHITETTHVWNRTAEKFSEELSKRSNGRMKVAIFPAGQLGAEKDMVQQMESGSVDFGIITNAYMSTRSDSLNGWFMPFAFSNLEQAAKAKDTAPAKEMLKELDKQGLIGMDFILAGNRHVLMKTGAVQSPEELKGKKLRVIGSPAIQDFWKTVGASPTPMPLPEVYQALQTGVIDGIDIDLDALNTQKYYEIAKDLTLTNHMTFPGVVVMGKASAAKLSPEDMQIVTDSMKAAVEWGTAEAIKGEAANLEQLKAKGIQITNLQNSESFNSVKDQLVNKYSANPVIKSFVEEAKK